VLSADQPGGGSTWCNQLSPSEIQRWENCRSRQLDGDPASTKRAIFQASLPQHQPGARSSAVAALRAEYQRRTLPALTASSVLNCPRRTPDHRMMACRCRQQPSRPAPPRWLDRSAVRSRRRAAAAIFSCCLIPGEPLGRSAVCSTRPNVGWRRTPRQMRREDWMCRHDGVIAEKAGSYRQWQLVRNALRNRPHHGCCRFYESRSPSAR
jgi:hypothetical protein